MPKLSKEDVIAKLEELAVIYDPQASYSDLLKLLQSQGENKPLEQANEEKKEEIALTPETPEEIKAVEEVKNVNPFFSFETKQPLTGKAQMMRKILMSQPRVPVYIPLGPEEKIGSTHQVTLNGYTMFIRKGQQVDVPVQVREVLEEKFRHQMNLREHPLRVSNIEDVKLKKFD